MARSNLVMHVFSVFEHRELGFGDAIAMKGVTKIDRACRRFNDDQGQEHLYVVLSDSDQLLAFKGMKLKAVMEDYRFVSVPGWFQMKKELLL